MLRLSWLRDYLALQLSEHRGSVICGVIGNLVGNSGSLSGSAWLECRRYWKAYVFKGLVEPGPDVQHVPTWKSSEK